MGRIILNFLVQLMRRKNGLIFLYLIYLLCQLVILRGDFEGFGIVYLEANLAKKPVIAGDSGGVRDAVVHNLNGLVVDPENSF